MFKLTDDIKNKVLAKTVENREQIWWKSEGASLKNRDGSITLKLDAAAFVEDRIIAAVIDKDSLQLKLKDTYLYLLELNSVKLLALSSDTVEVYDLENMPVEALPWYVAKS